MAPCENPIGDCQICRRLGRKQCNTLVPKVTLVEETNESVISCKYKKSGCPKVRKIVLVDTFSILNSRPKLMGGNKICVPMYGAFQAGHF